jgi:DNA-directed RNA polymerase specialized sigma24 family protein
VDDKPDQYWVDAWKSTNKDDRDNAWLGLREKYQPMLEGMVGKKYPSHLVEDVVNDIWVAFFDYILVEEIRKGVSQVLSGIAKHKIADAVDDLKHEIDIENDILSEMLTTKERVEVAKRIDGGLDYFLQEKEELNLKNQQLELIPQIPYATTLLNGCDRVFWLLREKMDYKSRMIAELTRTSEGVVNNTLHRARKKVGPFLESAEFYRRQAREEILRDELSDSSFEPTLIVEWFSKSTTPTPGLDPIISKLFTFFDIQDECAFGLIVPGSYAAEQYFVPGRLYLLFAEKAWWEKPLIDFLGHTPKPTHNFTGEVSTIFARVDIVEDTVNVYDYRTLRFDTKDPTRSRTKWREMYRKYYGQTDSEICFSTHSGKTLLAWTNISSSIGLISNDFDQRYWLPEYMDKCEQILHHQSDLKLWKADAMDAIYHTKTTFSPEGALALVKEQMSEDPDLQGLYDNRIFRFVYLLAFYLLVVPIATIYLTFQVIRHMFNTARNTWKYIGVTEEIEEAKKLGHLEEEGEPPNSCSNSTPT